MTSIRFLLTALILVAIPVGAERPKYQFVREKGAIYVRDFLHEDEVIEFSVLKDTKVYSTSKAKRVIGTLSGMRKARLEAISTYALRVRGHGTSGSIVGWVNPKDLKAPNDTIIDQLKAADERRKQVDKLIAERKIALGMTIDEVEESLGTPTKRASRVTAKGRNDTWEYVIYEKIPRYNYVRDPYTGRTYQQLTHYEKIEKGKTSVEFTEGVVSAIAEAEDLSRRQDLLLVPAPLVFVGL